MHPDTGISSKAMSIMCVQANPPTAPSALGTRAPQSSRAPLGLRALRAPRASAHARGQERALNLFPFSCRNSFINDIFEKIAMEAARLARYNKKVRGTCAYRVARPVTHD